MGKWVSIEETRTETVKYSSILCDMLKPNGNTHIETNLDHSCKYNFKINIDVCI